MERIQVTTKIKRTPAKRKTKFEGNFPLISQRTRGLVTAVVALLSLGPAAATAPADGVHTTDFDWGTWWGYDGISGPSFWGVINRSWRLCSDGRRQSPINLATESVVFDHTLSPLSLGGNEMDGILTNTGFGLRWTPASALPRHKSHHSYSQSSGLPISSKLTGTSSQSSSNPSLRPYSEASSSRQGSENIASSPQRESWLSDGTLTGGDGSRSTQAFRFTSRESSPSYFNVSRGPPPKPFVVSDGPFHYKYALSHITLRWSGSSSGSEHSLQNNFFPAEVQLYFYNMDLYRNFSEASDRANGVAAVAIFLKEGRESNPFLGAVLDHLPNVHQRGSTWWVRAVPLRAVFTSPHYLTYEGSLTEPPCEETVTWALLNWPAYISSQQLLQLQNLRRGGQGQTAPTVGNVRPTQPLNSRPVRTNVPPHLLSCYNTNRTGIYQAAPQDHS